MLRILKGNQTSQRLYLHSTFVASARVSFVSFSQVRVKMLSENYQKIINYGNVLFHFFCFFFSSLLKSQNRIKFKWRLHFFSIAPLPQLVTRFHLAMKLVLRFTQNIYHFKWNYCIPYFLPSWLDFPISAEISTLPFAFYYFIKPALCCVLLQNYKEREKKH